MVSLFMLIVLIVFTVLMLSNFYLFTLQDNTVIDIQPIIYQTSIYLMLLATTIVARWFGM